METTSDTCPDRKQESVREEPEKVQEGVGEARRGARKGLGEEERVGAGQVNFRVSH